MYELLNNDQNRIKIRNLYRKNLKSPINILIIEDNEDDLILLVRFLRSRGLNFIYQNVETAEDMKKMIIKEKFDLILADYSLPSFNGIEALKMMNLSGQDIPFIIVSGTIGEEVAVGAMIAGAHDYIMKNNMARLVPAIKRELKESQIRKDQKQMEQELINAQKLESLGIFAGGIAHDFNNFLTTILGNIQLASFEEKPEILRKYLLEAEKAIMRTQKLSQQLLTLSTGGAPIKNLGSISEVLKDTIDFTLSGSNIKSQYNLSRNLWQIDMDEGQIGQVISNIATNALQAMVNGGIFKVVGKNKSIKPWHNPLIMEGDYVKLSFIDSGVGISPENLPKIFVPFYTTKEKGHGLGLSISYSIIKNHKGYIFVKSEIGKGTIFNIYLPASKDQSSVEKSIENTLIYGKGHILILDDNRSIIKILERMLIFLGYTVEFSHDGNETLEIYRKGSFDAVITDLTIPGGLGGKELIKNLLRIDPKVSVIVSSGYSNDPIMANFKKFGFSGILKKPYKILELSKVLNSVLNKK